MNKPEARKIALVVAVFVIAGAVWALTGGVGSDEPMAYFYDLSERKLFEAPRNSFPPIEGIGGEPGDGVQAIVVRCPECGEDQKHRIAYLKTHTPEYKQKRDEAERAGTRIEGLTRPWIAENTLVRAVDGEVWHVANTEEGAEIVRGQKRRCAEHGKWEKPCMP